MYTSLNAWMSRTRGGIALVTAVMAIVMAAMSGIIGGEVVLLGLIALPQMLRLGYDQNLAIGTICASGSLGTMIPPSIVLIFYGLITETSIHGLVQGGIPSRASCSPAATTALHHRAHPSPPRAGAAAPSPPTTTSPSGRRRSCSSASIALTVGVASPRSTSGVQLLQLGVNTAFPPTDPEAGPPEVSWAAVAPYVLVPLVALVAMGARASQARVEHGQGADRAAARRRGRARLDLRRHRRDHRGGGHGHGRGCCS